MACCLMVPMYLDDFESKALLNLNIQDEDEDHEEIYFRYLDSSSKTDSSCIP